MQCAAALGWSVTRRGKSSQFDSGGAIILATDREIPLRGQVLQEVQAVVDRHDTVLKDIFCQYAGGGRLRSIGHQRIDQTKILKFSRAFQLCPGLLQRIGVLQLFQRSLSTASTKDKGILGFEDFVMWLSGCAGMAFSGVARTYARGLRRRRLSFESLPQVLTGIRSTRCSCTSSSFCCFSWTREARYSRAMGSSCFGVLPLNS